MVRMHPLRAVIEEANPLCALTQAPPTAAAPPQTSVGLWTRDANAATTYVLTLQSRFAW